MTTIEQMAKAHHDAAFAWTVANGGVPNASWDELSPKYQAREITAMRAAVEVMAGMAGDQATALWSTDLPAIEFFRAILTEGDEG